MIQLLPHVAKTFAFGTYQDRDFAAPDAYLRIPQRVMIFNVGTRVDIQQAEAHFHHGKIKRQHREKIWEDFAHTAIAGIGPTSGISISRQKNITEMFSGTWKSVWATNIRDQEHLKM